jgi:hypothetical protein
MKHEKVVEHPQLKMDRALALLLARAHARQHGKPRPDAADIGPAAFTRLSPRMSRDEQYVRLVETLRRIGLKPDEALERKVTDMKQAIKERISPPTSAMGNGENSHD